MTNTRKQFERLFQKYLSGEMTHEEMQIFREQLKSFSQLEKDYLYYEKIQSILANLSHTDSGVFFGDNSYTVSEFEKLQFQKKFRSIDKNTKPSAFMKRINIFMKLAATILFVTGVYWAVSLDYSKEFLSLYPKNTKYIVKDTIGRCYSNGVLLKKGEIFDNTLIQSAKNSYCYIVSSNEKNFLSIRLFPETEIQNIQIEGKEVWKLNQGKIYTESNQPKMNFQIKDHLITRGIGVSFIEFEKSRLNIESIKGKTEVVQNASFLFGNRTNRIVTQTERKLFEEKLPQVFGDLKSEIDEGTAYTLEFDSNKLNQKELILQEIESILSSDKKEVSQNAFNEVESFLKLSGPKIQTAINYTPEADFPYLKDNRENILNGEILSFFTPKIEKIVSTNSEESLEFAKEEEEYYKLAQENLNKKPALIFTLSLKDSTSLIGELSHKDGFYIIKTKEGNEMEVPSEKVALIELK